MTTTYFSLCVTGSTILCRTALLARTFALLLLYFCLAKPGMGMDLNPGDLKHINVVPWLDYTYEPDKSRDLADFVRQHGQDETGIWQPIQGEMLNFGYIKGAAFFRLNLSVLPDKDIVSTAVFFDLHKILDGISLHVYSNGELKYEFSSSANLVSKEISTNNNVFNFSLQSGATYQIFIHINSEHSITGEVGLWSKDAYVSAQQKELYGMTFYAISMFFIIAFCFFAFLSTGLPAFKYHMIYGASVLGLQAAQYGYFDRIWGYENSAIRNALICSFVATSSYAVINFMQALVAEGQLSRWFSRLMSGLASLTLLGMVFISFVPFRLMVTYSFTIMGVFFLFSIVYVVRSIKPMPSDAKRVGIVAFVLFPPVLLLMLSRYGIINQGVFSEYLLMSSVLVEMLVMSGLLYHQIQGLNKRYLRAQYFDEDTQLPNVIALRMVGKELAVQKVDYLFARVWLSGLDRMEMMMGVDFYQKFLLSLAHRLQEVTSQQDFVLESALPDNQYYGLFLAEKNIFVSFLTSSSEYLLELYHAQIVEVVREAKQEFQYNMEIRPLIVGVFSTPEKSINQVMQDAHTAMLYSYKRKWQVQIYNEEIGKIEHRQLILVRDFQDALRDNQFHLLWQPQFNARSLQMAGMEVLARWTHPVFGPVSPDVFIPLLEGSMHISSLTRWVIREVFVSLPRVCECFPGVDVSINLSVHDLLSDDLVIFLDEQLIEFPGMQKHITLEVTESMMIKDGDTVLATVLAIQQRGFKFSIDDFGAGYTSLSYLELLPANELKLDKRFVDSSSRTNSQAIVSSIIEMAKKLRMQVVVEGIEEQQQADLFIHLGVERLQGWRYGKPMRLQDLIYDFSQRETPAVLSLPADCEICAAIAS